MRIAKLELQNWMAYRGKHELVLGAKVYAVIAQAEEDPERSNWLGKSSFLEAIDFALWGRHRHRTEDEWITDGEAIGEVQLTLDTGARIIRRRERGKRTTLHYYGPEIPKGALQDEAQRIVGEVVGLSQEDFLATCYFQQRQMARLILARASERMNIVSAWLRLDPLERCEDKVKSEATVLGDQVRQMESQVASLDEMEKHALDGSTREKMAELLVGHEEVLEKRRGQHANIQNQIQKNARLISAQGKVQDFEQIVADGKKLKAELAKTDGAKLKSAHAKAEEEYREIGKQTGMARAQLDSKKDLAKGEFNGTCPLAGIQCPAKTEINKDRKRGLKLFEEARDHYDAIGTRYEAARTVEGELRVSLGEFTRKEDRLADMRQQAAKMEADYELAKQGEEALDPQVLKLRLEDTGRKLDEAMTIEKTTKARLEQLQGIDRRRETLTAALGELRARLAVYREAMAIFGKQGAQRRVAEGALAEIEDGANEMLREAHIDLTVGVKWSREGDGLAKACDTCGNPFPASAKAKVCQRCQSARGPNLINKLEIELSDESGAAEDLGGAATQLSASAWLRNERGSMWGVAMLDEPFGQLDASNRRGLGLHLAAMLRGRYGFEQAFVVAHSPDVLHALPGRIEIIGGPNGSTIRVAA